MNNKRKRYRNKKWLKKKYIKEGLTDREIGKLERVSHRTIVKWRDKFNIVRPTPKYKDKTWLEQKFVHEGLSDKEIGSICGVWRQTILQWRQKFNIYKPEPKYINRDWLYKQRITKERQVMDIAKECNVHPSTIYEYLRNYNIAKNYKYDNPEWLEKKYIKEKLSDKEIANLCEANGPWVITHRRSQFGIESRSNAEAQALVKGNHVSISPKLLKILDGSLLGDGSLFAQSSYSAKYFLLQKHHAYCKWVSNLLKGLGVNQSGKIQERKESANEVRQRLGKKIKEKDDTLYSYFYQTLSYQEFYEQYERWYPNGKKRIPDKLSLAPLSMLIWFLEDGSFANRKLIAFHTCSFTTKRLETLVEKMEDNLNIAPVNLSTEGEYPYIFFQKRPVVKAFFNYLPPLPEMIAEDYAYKFPEGYPTKSYF